MTKLDELYAPVIRTVLNTAEGREFFVYIVRELGYCDKLHTNEDVIRRNAAVDLLEKMMDVAGIRVNVLKID